MKPKGIEQIFILVISNEAKRSHCIPVGRFLKRYLKPWDFSTPLEVKKPDPEGQALNEPQRGFIARLVLPTQAGIQYFQEFLDARLCGHDKKDVWQSLSIVSGSQDRFH